jgi:hypothetical protein
MKLISLSFAASLFFCFQDFYQVYFRSFFTKRLQGTARLQLSCEKVPKASEHFGENFPESFRHNKENSICLESAFATKNSVLSSFVDFKITDRKNVDIKIVE